jgi:HD superfamily phosphohydrolase
VSQINKLKIFNDPIYGFITIPNALIYDLIQHPYFQRLRRISQMGLSIWFIRCQSYPFSSRFGLYASDAKAVVVLRFSISVEEEKCALYCYFIARYWAWAFLTLWKSIVEDVHHEEISLLFMHQLNTEFNGQLDLIQVFKGDYHRLFMLQLISNDMDRMDYLKRDSFYSGVAEGNVNSERLIQMMNVVDDVLVIEEKGFILSKISNVQTINVLASYT